MTKQIMLLAILMVGTVVEFVETQNIAQNVNAIWIFKVSNSSNFTKMRKWGFDGKLILICISGVI